MLEAAVEAIIHQKELVPQEEPVAEEMAVMRLVLDRQLLKVLMD